jgi:ERCC4-related helicase
MRLIAGADLDSADVRAILAGDSQHLAARLNRELEKPEEWPQDVRNGVTLLAWMVANGHLEVRVGFRVHGATGEPLRFGALDDGYVHEKWLVLYDEFGNRLYGAGTLNESKTALVLNAENIDVHCDWWADTDRRRVDEAEGDFERLWEGRVPQVRVFTLPEAVRRLLIQLAEGVGRPLEINGTSAAPKVVEPPSTMERLQFAILRDAPRMPSGRFVGLETAPVAPWPHQAIVVRRLVETWPYSYLLCDEVGLGKTIEAGLAFRSLYLSGLAKRILVAAPATLTEQWQRQMASKLLLPFARALTGTVTRHQFIFPNAEERPASSIYDPDLVIVSTGLLGRRDREGSLEAAKLFDVAVVDEAHALRRRNPAEGLEAHPDYGLLYTVVRNYLRTKSRSLWLATATPMQIHPVEVCDLLTVMNRVGAFQFDPTLTLQYYQVLGKLTHGEEPTENEWAFLRQAIAATERQDPLLWRFLDGSVIDGRIRATVRQWLDHGWAPHERDRGLVNRLIFSASPLSRVMLRHNRRLLEIYREKGQLQENLARRVILAMPRIVFTPLEQQVYEKLEAYCDGLAEQVRKHGDSQTRLATGFLLSFMRLRFASSLYAILRTLQRRREKAKATLNAGAVQVSEEQMPQASVLADTLLEYEDESDDTVTGSLLKNRSPADLQWEEGRLNEMIASMVDLSGRSSKMEELLRDLDKRRDLQTKRIRQTVIFTRFYDTLTDIVNRLLQVDPSMLIGTYSGKGGGYLDAATGQLVDADRDAVKERFLRGEIDILVCTDAAAEGLNLQTADLVINFDLGWNPMKVEQRIGRIDRIGQKHEEVYVLNLCYADSAEAVVYGRLLSRLSDANLIVGTQQVSLLPVGPEDFQRLAEGTMSPEQLEAEARKRLEEQRRRSESMEMAPEDLYDVYTRLAEANRAQSAPIDMEGIWQVLSGSKYLSDIGCFVPAPGEAPVMTLSAIEGIPDGALLTVSRQVYDEGVRNAGRVRFASYGEPLFDAILAHMQRFELPRCVRRISVQIPGLEGVEMVGYAAVCRGGGGVREIGLIKSLRDLAGLEPVEAESLSDEEIAPRRYELERLAMAEFSAHVTADRVERANVRAARAQEMLDLLIADSLLDTQLRANGEGALFWPTLRGIAASIADHDSIPVTGLPADYLRPIANELLFDCRPPAVGSEAYMQVPISLARAAIDAATRLADGLRERKTELALSTVMARILREVEAKRRELS